MSPDHMLFAPRVTLVVAVDDVDGLRQRIGAAATDRLFLAIAARLVNVVAADGSVRALWAGRGIFRISHRSITDETSANRLAQRLHEAVRAPVNFRGLQYYLSVSIGIAVGNTVQAEVLERAAVTAMQRVALNGGDATFTTRVARVQTSVALAS